MTHYQAIGGVDTSSVSGGLADSFVFDGCFQDIEPKTGQPQFTFCSIESGISINESFVTPLVTPNSTDNAWDYLHVRFSLPLSRDADLTCRLLGQLGR